MNKAVLITDSDLILYFTSYTIEDGFLFLYSDKKYLFTDKRYFSSLKNKSDLEVSLIQTESLKNFIINNKISSVGLVYSLTSISLYNEVKSLGVEVFDATDDVNHKTSVKSQTEIEKIKKACNLLESAYKKSLKELKAGITEIEFAGLLEYNFKLLGGEKPAFDTIVAFGEGTAIPHYKTSNNTLKSGDAVLIDCGLKFKGYCSDLTRSFMFDRVTDEYLTYYNLVLNAHLKAASGITSQMTGKQADALARDYFTENNVQDYFIHSLGHGVGVKIHEYPTLSPKSEWVLKNGNVFTIEPGVYLENKFGIRIEDTVLLCNGKVQSFMSLDKTCAVYLQKSKKCVKH